MEIRITFFFIGTGEINNPVFLIDMFHIQYGPFTTGDRIFECTCCQVIEIQMSPVAAFGKPDHLVRGWQHPPVGFTESTLIIGVLNLFQYRANRTRVWIGNLKFSLLMVSG